NGGICHWLRPIHRVTRLSTIRWLDAVLMLPSCAISSAVVGESVNIYRTLDAPRHNDSVETQYALTNTNYAHGLVLLQLPDADSLQQHEDHLADRPATQFDNKYR